MKRKIRRSQLKEEEEDNIKGETENKKKKNKKDTEKREGKRKKTNE